MDIVLPLFIILLILYYSRKINDPKKLVLYLMVLWLSMFFILSINELVFDFLVSINVLSLEDLKDGSIFIDSLGTKYWLFAERIISRLLGATSVVFFWRIIVLVIERNGEYLAGDGSLIVKCITHIKVALGRAESRVSNLFALTFQVFIAVFILNEIILFIFELWGGNNSMKLGNTSYVHALLGIKAVRPVLPSWATDPFAGAKLIQESLKSQPWGSHIITAILGLGVTVGYDKYKERKTMKNLVKTSDSPQSTTQSRVDSDSALLSSSLQVVGTPIPCESMHGFSQYYYPDVITREEAVTQLPACIITRKPSPPTIPDLSDWLR